MPVMPGVLFKHAGILSKGNIAAVVLMVDHTARRYVQLCWSSPLLLDRLTCSTHPESGAWVSAPLATWLKPVDNRARHA